MTLDCYYLGTRLPFGSIRTSPCASISWDFLLKSTASARRTIEPFSQPLSRHIDSSTSPLSRRTESVSALRLRRGTWVNTYRVAVFSPIVQPASTSVYASLCFLAEPQARLEARMESLLLFRRALSSPTMCRFIPALSVTETVWVLDVSHPDHCQETTETAYGASKSFPPDC
jgi:hypothetical protein